MKEMNGMMDDKVFCSKELYVILDKFIDSIDTTLYSVEDIKMSDKFLEFYLDNQQLRTAIRFYLHIKSPPMNKAILDNTKSPTDIINHEKSMTTLAFKLLNGLRTALSLPISNSADVHSSDVRKFVFQMYLITEEFAWATQREELWISNIFFDQKELSDEINKVKSYGDNVEKVKVELNNTLQEITEEIRTQKIDALTMTTLVFTAFTFLTVNAGVITGMSQIEIIDTSQMIRMFLVGNATVLFGIIIIILLLRRVFQGK